MDKTVATITPSLTSRVITDASFVFPRASFKTIWPGWYAGRAIHIHVRVRTFDAGRTWRDVGRGQGAALGS